MEDLIGAREKKALKDISDFYELGSPADWKELVKYARFYLAEENKKRRGMIFDVLKPLLERRGRYDWINVRNLDEIATSIAGRLSDNGRNELRAFIHEREKLFDEPNDGLE